MQRRMLLLELTFTLLLIASGCCGADQHKTQLNKCSNLCSVCQSLQQAQALKVCSVNLLHRCSCESYAIDNTRANGTDSVPDNCPQTSTNQPEEADVFCRHGTARDNNGCPTKECAVGSGCDKKWHQKCHNGVWCPNGYRLDSNGCPTCDCACENSTLAGNNCAADCVKFGAKAQLVMRDNNESDCPQCVCIAEQKTGSSSSSSNSCKRTCSNDCGSYGHANTTTDSNGCIADCSCRCPARDPSQCPANCRLTWAIDEHGCEVCRCALSTEPHWCPPPPRCSTSCGPHGFRVTGDCRRDCQCACPPVQCPADCSSLKWRSDRYGCATCQCEEQKQPRDVCPLLKCASCGQHGYKMDSNNCQTCQCKCPKISSLCPGSTCARWGTDQFGCATCLVCHATKPCVQWQQANLTELCSNQCSAYSVKSDSNGCISCSCTDNPLPVDCPTPPACLVGCGLYPRKRDANGCITGCDCECPKFDLRTCMVKCKQHFTVSVDQYGCQLCQCKNPHQCPLKLRCANDCGSHGYVADANGCQTSCNCNCPSLQCPQHCIFGYKTDKYGCNTDCSCASIFDWHNDMS